MSQPTDNNKVTIIRKALGLNKSELAQKLGVSATLISAIERGTKRFTLPIKNRFVEILGVNEGWIFNEQGHPFAKQTLNSDKLNQTAAEVLDELSQLPFPPLSVADIAIGISTEDIVKRICQAYSAKNIKELATKHLHISPTAISAWIKRNKIPDEQIHKIIREGKITPEQLLSNNKYVLIKKLDLVEIYREMYVGSEAKRPVTIDEIKTELDRRLEKWQKPIESKE